MADVLNGCSICDVEFPVYLSIGYDVDCPTWWCVDVCLSEKEATNKLSTLALAFGITDCCERIPMVKSVTMKCPAVCPPIAYAPFCGTKGQLLDNFNGVPVGEVCSVITDE